MTMSSEYGSGQALVRREHRQEHQRDQFERLARNVEPLMMRVALRMCGGNADRAADCVQEAILNAFRSFMKGGLDDISGFRPWMLRILTHEVYAVTAKESKTVPTEKIDDLVEAMQERESRTERELMNSILDEDLELALKSLNADQQMLVLLVDVEELDYAEAAQTLGIPMGTVRSRLARARLQLNELLTEARRRSSHV
jgi:RNA polymerase sigma-70 factor (ECF subfamily)